MFTFPRFIGCVCTLGLAFFMSVATPLSILATEVTTVTDTWVPLDEAWSYVEDLYTTYNTALSEDSGVTITEDNYQDYVIKSIIGNFVATHEAYGEDVSLDGLVEVIMADADLLNALGSATLVNPLNGAYYLGESMGASLRSSIDNFLESTFGLTDIMTTSEAVGLDFPEGRVFVKLISDGVSDGIVTIGDKTWVYMSEGLDTTYTAGGGSVNVVNNSSSGIYWTIAGDYMLVCSYISSDGTLSVTPGTSYVASELITGNGYLFGYKYWWSGMDYLWAYVGYASQYDSTSAGVNAFYNATPPSSDPEYSDPVVVINDEDPPIVSPTSVYNDWTTISNNNYNTYTTEYVTYNTGDSIYNYTYYYSINNYTDDMPLWVVNGKDLPVYEFDRETFYDFSNTNYTVSEDLVWDSSFFDYVMEHIPIEIFTILVTMLIASAFFLLFKH